MQLFTKKKLKDLASSTSSQRGQAYYEKGCVRKVTRKGNIFEGTVEGSYRYRVSLKINQGEPDFACRYNPLFYIQLLEAEGKQLLIMDLLKKYKNQEVPEFDKMLATVAFLFPDECINLIMEKTEHALQSERRGRHTYQQITFWLKVLKNIPALEGPLKIFSQYLYDKYARLRALREELLYTGLI